MVGAATLYSVPHNVTVNGNDASRRQYRRIIYEATPTIAILIRAVYIYVYVCIYMNQSERWRIHLGPVIEIAYTHFRLTNFLQKSMHDG